MSEDFEYVCKCLPDVEPGDGKCDSCKDVARLNAIEARWREVQDKINGLYWIFTRSARGTPPCIVAPELYSERRALEIERRAILRRLA